MDGWLLMNLELFRLPSVFFKGLAYSWNSAADPACPLTPASQPLHTVP